MTPEQALWQAVAYAAIADACRARDDLASNMVMKRALRAEKEADVRYIASRNRDFAEVCSLAGMDHDFIREAFLTRRLTSETLRQREIMGASE